MSDTSPIRALDFLGLLPVLQDLFGQVLIPPAVRDELISPLPRFGVVDLSKHDFIEVRSPRDEERVEEFQRQLDRGESEALALVLETGAKLLLIDELRGRRTAAQHGVAVLGALGVLVRAKARGLMPEIRPLIEKLDELEFFMSEQLKNDVLRMAGE